MEASENARLSQTFARCLAVERVDAYRTDGADEQVALARYLLNMALAEALYPLLQFAEIALRNAIHHAMSGRLGSAEWFDKSESRLTHWQMENVEKARESLCKGGKPLTAGRIVAELNFGFWTGFFNKAHVRTGIGHYLAKAVFSHAPKSERDLVRLDGHWSKVRNLRNRVFHHERILHWNDLEDQHANILRLIGWIDPHLQELSQAMDRFPLIRHGGLGYWKEQSGRLLGLPAPEAVKPPDWMIVDETTDYDGEDTVFGPRWGSGATELSPAALTALTQGRYIACDVRQEYIHYLKLKTT